MHPTPKWKHQMFDYKPSVLSRFFDADFCNSCFSPASNQGQANLKLARAEHA
jgi:hypothetical protein